MNASETTKLRFVRESLIEEGPPERQTDAVRQKKEADMMDYGQEEYKLGASVEEIEHILKMEERNLKRAIAAKMHQRRLEEMRLKDELSEKEDRLEIEKLNAKQEALKVQHQEAERVRQREEQIEAFAHGRHMEKMKLEKEIKQKEIEKIKLQSEENDRSREYEAETAEKQQEREKAKLLAINDRENKIRAHELELETERMHHAHELSKLTEDMDDEWHKKQKDMFDRLENQMQEKRKNQQEEMTQLLNSILTLNVVTGERRQFIKIRKKARIRDLFRKVRQEILKGIDADFTLVFQTTNLDENAYGDIDSHGIQSLNTIGVMLRMRGGGRILCSFAVVMFS